MFATSSTRVVLALALLLALSHVGTCLDCYACLATEDNCNDPFITEGAAKETCVAPLNGCQKIVVADMVAIRSCSTKGICDLAGAAGGTCHFCTGELCNSSSTIMPSILVTSFVAVIVAKYFM